MKFLALTKRTMIYIVLSIVVLSVLVFLFLEFKGLPNCKISNTQEAANVFKNYLDGIDKILEPYGLRCEQLEVFNDDEEYGYTIQTYICLDNDELLRINLSYAVSGNYPPEFTMFLDSKEYRDFNECYLDLEKHPYLFDIASYLCDDRFSSEQYRNYLIAAKDRVEKRREKGETIPIRESKYLRSALFSLGGIVYSIGTDNDKYYATASIVMALYD